jgi:hypothetical protein
MMLKLSSSTLRKAAVIQEEIEKLDAELRNLLTEVPGPESRANTGIKSFVARRARRQVNESAQRSGVQQASDRSFGDRESR